MFLRIKKTFWGKYNIKNRYFLSMQARLKINILTNSCFTVRTEKIKFYMISFVKKKLPESEYLQEKRPMAKL